MDKIKLTRETIAAKEAEFRRLMEGELTDEVRGQLDNLTAEMETLQGDLKRFEQAEEIAKRSANLVTMPSEGGEAKEKEKALRRYSLHKVIQSRLSNQPLTGVENEFAQEVAKRNIATGTSSDGAGYGVPSEIFVAQKRAALSVTGDSGTYGAETVSEELGGLISAINPYLVAKTLGARMMSNLKGNMSLPRETSAPEGGWEGEITDANDVAGTIDNVALVPKRLAAYVSYTYQMLAQSELGIEQYARNRVLRAIANMLDKAYFQGSGSSNQPSGLCTTIAAYNSGSQVIAIGTNGGALTWDLVVSMEKLIDSDSALAGALAYATNAKVVGALKTIKKDSGSGIFLLENGEVNGYKVAKSNYIKSNGTKNAGSNLSTMLFGNFDHSVIANWGDVYVDVETNAGAGSKKVVVNSFWDIACLQEKSFSIITDITT